MSRRGRPRPTAATSGQRRPTEPTHVRYRIVIHEISDEDERLLANYTVDGYVAAIGRRLPNHQFEHNTLRSGPLDLTLDLANVIPDNMAEFIEKAFARALRRIAAPDGLAHSRCQSFVPLTISRSSPWFAYLGRPEVLAVMKLVACEVQFDPGGQPVPGVALSG
jgi:hypothetical protein